MCSALPETLPLPHLAQRAEPQPTPEKKTDGRLLTPVQGEMRVQRAPRAAVLMLMCLVPSHAAWIASWSPSEPRRLTPPAARTACTMSASSSSSSSSSSEGRGRSRGDRATPARLPSPRVVLLPMPFPPIPLTASRVATVYRQLSTDFHIEVASAQAGLLGASSDSICQVMHGLPLDASHVASMGVLAAALSGAWNAKWLETLENAVPGSSDRAVLTKTVADYCIAGVLANSAYLVAVPIVTALFAGAPLPEALALNGWTVEGFRYVMLVELCTFAPYNLCAFKLVPPRLRPLSAATVSASCAIAMSGVTLGFGIGI